MILSPAEISLLSKGIGFNHTDATPTNFLAGLESVLLASDRRADIRNCATGILRQKRRQQTLPADEAQGLQSLKSDHNIVVFPADKSGATVIMDRIDYVNKANGILGDIAVYTLLAEDPTKKQAAAIKKKVDGRPAPFYSFTPILHPSHLPLTPSTLYFTLLSILTIESPTDHRIAISKMRLRLQPLRGPHASLEWDEKLHSSSELAQMLANLPIAAAAADADEETSVENRWCQLRDTIQSTALAVLGRDPCRGLQARLSQLMNRLTALFQEMWRQGEVPQDFNDGISIS
ncbi:hypothetical protein SprV_0702274100 [Sparganum proliferum]